MQGKAGVRGRLRQCYNYWETVVHAPPFILEIVSDGYKLPFTDFPRSCFLQNNSSAIIHRDFVESAIEKLLLHGCIKEITFPPYCVNPLSVATGKKLRLVIDLRHVNSFIQKNTFRYEDLRSLSKVFDSDYWFFTWDLESGYHHVDIFEQHRKFLGFAWFFREGYRYFCFNVLPFGLSSACFCFTKLLRPLVKRWRSMGHNCFVYLDDGIGGMPDRISATASSIVQQKDLELCGLKLNSKKSHLQPMQVGEWLGFVIDTIKMEFRVPLSKIHKLKSSIDAMLVAGGATFRDLAKIAGFLNSLRLAVGPIARLFTRQMHFTIQCRKSWDCHIQFSAALKEELQFWYQNIDAYNGFAIQPQFTPGAILYCDASDFAFGGYSVKLGDQPVTGMFSSFESIQSSTYRELKAIYYVLKAHAVSLSHKKVKIFTDNQNASRIVLAGSRKQHLQSIAVDIFALCVRFDIQIDIQWIPRFENQAADELSRYVDRDDWSLNPEVFAELEHRWGPHSIDRFASHYNAQVSRFCSKFKSPGCEAVDAFAHNWSDENNWLCPPVSVIVDVIKHAQACEAVGTLVVPVWPSAFFWPLLKTLSSDPTPVVVDSVTLPRRTDLIIPGPGQKLFYRNKPSVFFGCPKFNMLALRIDFRLGASLLMGYS